MIILGHVREKGGGGRTWIEATVGEQLCFCDVSILDEEVDNLTNLKFDTIYHLYFEKEYHRSDPAYELRFRLIHTTELKENEDGTWACPVHYVH